MSAEPQNRQLPCRVPEGKRSARSEGHYGPVAALAPWVGLCFSPPLNPIQRPCSMLITYLRSLLTCWRHPVCALRYYTQLPPAPWELECLAQVMGMQVMGAVSKRRHVLSNCPTERSEVDTCAPSTALLPPLLLCCLMTVARALPGEPLSSRSHYVCLTRCADRHGVASRQPRPCPQPLALTGALLLYLRQPRLAPHTHGRAGV